MTRDETVALFLGCQAKRAEALKTGKTEDEAHEAARDHWNAWTQQMLDQRKAMEADGRWSAGLENEATRNWFSRALTDFSFCHFLSSDAINEQQEMECNAVVRRIAAGVRQDVQSILVDDAVVSFNNFMFPGHAWFVGSAFSVRISFDHSRFLGSASFKSAIFSDDSSFESASFSGFTSFEGATFSGSSWFNNVAFLDYALLRASFLGPAFFQDAAFRGAVTFQDQTFKHHVSFIGANFGSGANFSLTTFKRSVDFDKAIFQGEADFKGMFGERTFSMVGARFGPVPDFIQAHFSEAPRLDYTRVIGVSKNASISPRQVPRLARYILLRLVALLQMLDAYRNEDSPRRSFPARWRALKRLAVQAHDTDRELDFHARAVQSQRFSEDWPLPLKFLRGEAWASCFRFYFGMAYELVSNFGRSVFWPACFWAACIIVFAAFYLSQTDVMQRD